MKRVLICPKDFPLPEGTTYLLEALLLDVLGLES